MKETHMGEVYFLLSGLSFKRTYAHVCKKKISYKHNSFENAELHYIFIV